MLIQLDQRLLWASQCSYFSMRPNKSLNAASSVVAPKKICPCPNPYTIVYLPCIHFSHPPLKSALITLLSTPPPIFPLNCLLLVLYCTMYLLKRWTQRKIETGRGNFLAWCAGVKGISIGVKGISKVLTEKGRCGMGRGGCVGFC